VKSRHSRPYPQPRAEYLPDLHLPGGILFYNVVPDGYSVTFYVASDDDFIENAGRTVTLARSTWDAMVAAMGAAKEVKS
jgi:hypothetical protein